MLGLSLPLACGLVVPGSVAAEAKDIGAMLDAAIAGAHRGESNRARDRYRHPKETLLFFGLRPDMQVLEILSGRGWYTEILAPLLQGRGHLIATSYSTDINSEYLLNIHNSFIQLLDDTPEVYGQVTRGVFKSGNVILPDVPDASQDMVVTFRNTHNWVRFGGVAEVYQAFHRVLKPGGTLGVVQHRAKPVDNDDDAKEWAQRGYVPEKWLIHQVEGLGFKLADKSEINANPKDTRDHEEGVWTLPPAFRLGDKDREKYAAIGESDRMTLKFLKLP